MIDPHHEAIIELLASYALDAVDRDDYELVTEHISHCERCNAEVIVYRDVISRIANSGGDAPAELWDSIARRIEIPPHLGGSAPLSPGLDVPSLPPLIVTRKESARQSPPAGHRDWRFPRIGILGVAAVLLLIIAGLGVQVGRLNNHVNQIQSSPPEQAISKAATSALSDPQAHLLSLDRSPANGPMLARIAILPNGTAFFVNKNLPSLSDDQTYQLWGQVNGVLISLSVLGSDPVAVPFHVEKVADISVFAVTAERAGGVVSSDHVPVAVSAITTG